MLCSDPDMKDFVINTYLFININILIHTGTIHNIHQLRTAASSASADAASGAGHGVIGHKR